MSELYFLKKEEITKEKLIESGFITNKQFEEIMKKIKEGKSVNIVGQTCTGKTSLLKVIVNNLQYYVQKTPILLKDFIFLNNTSKYGNGVTSNKLTNNLLTIDQLKNIDLSNKIIIINELNEKNLDELTYLVNNNIQFLTTGFRYKIINPNTSLYNQKEEKTYLELLNFENKNSYIEVMLEFKYNEDSKLRKLKSINEKIFNNKE